MRQLVGFILASLFIFAAPASALVADGGDVLFVVVIDPGHGGADTGAVGRHGGEEKSVNLSVALKIAERLRKNPDIKVLLTRADDTFVPLNERASFANANGADVFVSIHSNAASSRRVTGVETFFLSIDATDDDAENTAALENAVVAPDGTRIQSEADDLKNILSDMTMTESHHESSRLAEVVQASLLKALGKQNRGVKQAPFVVLHGAEMPAVLVEIGFISNPAEEKRLQSKDEQARIAESVTQGVLGFKKTFYRRNIGVNETARKD